MKLMLICFLLSSFTLFGQETFTAGYIVNNAGDTIHGLLRSDPEEKLASLAVFKSKEGTIEEYTTGKIFAFGFDAGNVFRTVTYIDPTSNYNEKTHFAKLLFDGINNLYSFIRKDVYFFVAQIKQDTTYLLYDNLTTASGDVIEHGNIVNQLFFIARDCEKIRSRADGISYDEKTLLDYFIALDKCQGNEKASGQYFKKPKSETQIYFFAGGITFGEEYEIAVHGSVRFIFPTQSRKTSLNVGLSYLDAKHIDTFRDVLTQEHPYDHMAQIIEMPATIQYDILDKRIRPYVYAGLGLAYIQEKKYKSLFNTTESDDGFGLTLISGLGIDGYVSKKIYLKADLRYDFFFHYPVIGLGFRLK